MPSHGASGIESASAGWQVRGQQSNGWPIDGWKHVLSLLFVDCTTASYSRQVPCRPPASLRRAGARADEVLCPPRRDAHGPDALRRGGARRGSGPRGGHLLRGFDVVSMFSPFQRMERHSERKAGGKVDLSYPFTV